MPHPPHSPILISSDFFFCFPGWKSPQRKLFASMEKVKQKTAETLKDIKIDKFKNYFEQWGKKMSQ